jgi:hypothetical protein
VSIGDPPVTGSTGFVGKIGPRVVLWPLAFTATRATASFRHNIGPLRWVGISGEDQAGDTNHSPVAVPMRFDGTTAVATTVNVRTRSYDPDAGDTISVQGTPTTTSGTVSVTGGDLVITSAAAFTGELEVSFQLGDGTAKRSASKVYGTIAAPSTSMVCVDDTGYVVTMDTAKTLAVLANDTPSTGTVVTAVTQPAARAGRVTIPAGGANVLLTPVTGYTGPFSFTYTAKHTASNTTDTATVSGNVEEANATPWWKSFGVPRSNRLSARRSGISYSNGGAEFDGHMDQFERRVGLLDCYNGDMPWEKAPNDASNTVLNLRRTLGGQLFATADNYTVNGPNDNDNNVIDDNSQLNWGLGTGKWSYAWKKVPKGTICIMSIYFISQQEFTYRDNGEPANSPAFRAFSTPQMWIDIRDGVHDQNYRNMGLRLKKIFDQGNSAGGTALNPRGHDANHVVFRMHHENAQSNHYGVFPNTAVLYRNAMDRMITHIRGGLGPDHQDLHFCHAPPHSYNNKNPAGTTNPGSADFPDYLDWCPVNCDTISASCHPADGITGASLTDYNYRVSTARAASLGALATASLDTVGGKYPQGRPFCLPEWSPKNEGGSISDHADEQLTSMDTFLTANNDRLLCETHYEVWKGLDTSHYADTKGGGPDTPGSNAWEAGAQVIVDRWGLGSTKKPPP